MIFWKTVLRDAASSRFRGVAREDVDHGGSPLPAGCRARAPRRTCHLIWSWLAVDKAGQSSTRWRLDSTGPCPSHGNRRDCGI